MTRASNIRKDELQAVFSAARAHGYLSVEVSIERADGQCFRIIAKDGDEPPAQVMTDYDRWRARKA